MSLQSHEGWLFSEGNPPKHHFGGLHPKHARGYKNPWVYLKDIDRWYEFNYWSSCNWETRWPKDVPKEYRAQLLLIK